MMHGRLADFFFVGLAIVPAALAFGDLPHLAILLFVPLLLVACLFGMAEQVSGDDPGARKARPGADPGAAPDGRPRPTLRARIGKE